MGERKVKERKIERDIIYLLLRGLKERKCGI